MKMLSFQKRIQKTAATVLICLVAPTVTLFAKPQELNRIRAVVNGEPITQLEVDAALQMQVRFYLMGNKGRVSRAQAERDIREMEGKSLDELINQKLILSEFKRLGGEIKGQFIDESITKFIKERFGGDKDKFVTELKKSGMTIAQFRDVQRDQIAVQALTSQNVKQDGFQLLTERQKKKKYDEIKGKYASEGKVKLRMMSIPKKTATSSMKEQEALMKSIRSKLVKGADFGDLAKEYSDDSFADEGGYVGIIGKNKLNPGLTQLAYGLSTGEVSQPIEDGTHWRIMKSEGRVGQSVPTRAKLEGEIDKTLKGEQYQKRREQWLSKLRRDANVKIYD